MEFFSADFILPISTDPIPNGVVAIEDGVIIEIGTAEKFASSDIQRYKGVIMPGFVNAHCHLELSHMAGKTQTGTTLIPFISDVVKHREFEIEVILDAIQKHDSAMHQSGIQAVGDISNKIDTAATKDSSKIAYYTFVEMFDFMQANLTEPTIANYRAVFKDQSDKGLNKKSFVPHAPYSVSRQLFDFINRANPENAAISIHNQETLAENQLFEAEEGDFYPFYRGFGFNLEDFQAIGKGSIYYALQEMQPKHRNLFVHNTLSSEKDIQAAHRWSDNVYWVSCPNANLYIENRLPNYKNFINQGAKMCIGTDSIMSNWQLSVWEEVKTIKKYQSYVPIHDLLKWATINGAESLGYDKQMGSLEPGKSPGLVNIPINWQGEHTDISTGKALRISD
jgi:cytosine/adenosine deaminase-related metal-dependent hydrolase